MSLVNAEFSDFEDRDKLPDGERRKQPADGEKCDQPGDGEKRHQPGEGEKRHQPGDSEKRQQPGDGEKCEQPGDGEPRQQPSERGQRNGSGGDETRNGRDGLDGMGSPETEFDGVFTEWVRLRLRQHRKELGLSLAGLGAKLGVDWSTVRKWETGATRRCHPSMVPVIGDFLCGCHEWRLRRGLGDVEASGGCSRCVSLLSLLARLRGVPGLDGDTLALVEGIIALVRQSCGAGGGACGL